MATTGSVPSTLQTWSAGLIVSKAFEIYKNTNVKTAIDVLKSDTPILGLLAKDSEAKTTAVIEMMIIDLQNFLNLSRTMNDFQIKETALLIVRRYNFMKIADCKLIFDRIKFGQIKLYEGLDGQKILQVFEQWQEERWRSADEYNYNRHREITSGEYIHRDKPFTIGNPDAPEHEKVIEYMKTVANLLDKNK